MLSCFEHEKSYYIEAWSFFSMARKSGVVRHLLGHHLRKETDQYDTIAFGSMGKITSLDKNGDFNWQVYRKYTCLQIRVGSYKYNFLISHPKHMLWVLKRTVSETVLLSIQIICLDPWTRK